ncbi:MAG: substrate-binding domain-containing protein [Chthonomonadales bacterium]
MKRRSILMAIPAVVGMFLLAGCSGGGDEKIDSIGAPKKATDATGAGASGQKFVIGMSQCTLNEPWRVQMNKDIEDAAKEHPEITMIFRDASDKSETQQAQVREFIQQHVNLIIISPKESRPLTKPVAEAMDAGIPVIVLDRAVEGEKFSCFIGADNVKIGRELGKYMVKALGGKGNVIELKGLQTSKPGQDRHNGFVEGITGSQIKVIFDADCGWKEPTAQKEMASALSRFPQIDAVYGHNDPSAHGAYQAALQEGKGREKTIKFFGVDSLPTEGVKYAKDGILTATFQYPTGGKEAIDNAMKVLKKEPVPNKITLGTRIFTKENSAKGGDAL